MIVIERASNWWEACAFQFCKFPKAFLTNLQLRELSDGAKLLYAVLLDRMNLSALNNWRDRMGDIYIYYSNKELCETLNWSHDKVTKKLRELENMKLLRRRRQKLGQPDAIYVLPFLSLCEFSVLQSAENKDCGVQKSSNTECDFSAANKTDSNKTEFNNIYPSIYGYDEILKIIKENIDYEILSERKINKEELDNIVALMADVCCGTSSEVRIGGNDYPRHTVRNRFLNLNAQHIEYVMESFQRTTADINNIRAYLMAALYNAPVTMDYYWAQRVRHDMPQLALK